MSMEDFLVFVADVFSVDVGEISLETEYEAIPEWDSLMFVRLIVEIEEKYNVEIPIDKIDAIKTLADIYAYIQG